MKKIAYLALILASSFAVWMPQAAAQDPNAPPGDAQSMQQPVDQMQPSDEEQGRPWVEVGPDGQPVQPTSGSDAAPEDDTPVLTSPLRKGLSIQGSLGFSDCLGELCGNPDEGDTYEGSSLGIGGELSGWFRPIEYVSLGMNLHYNLIAVDDQPGFDNSWNYFVIDIGARVHPLATGPVDIFIGPTFGYGWFNTHAEGAAIFDFDVDVSGWTLGGELGGEYFITPQMSAGLIFRYLYPFWSEVCIDDGEVDDCVDVEDVDGLDDDLPTMFYIGATFTYHLQLGT